ncbi:MAG: DEAD/DEAH box helicase [Candidatus Eremiobacteraeota bacterium]|nr:DEAD/DEAH box helicase [Candidatus Eremiobacteraeota bacterium]
MNRRSRKTPNRLPLPTPSEAAFEKLLASFVLPQAQDDKAQDVLRQAQDDKQHARHDGHVTDASLVIPNSSKHQHERPPNHDDRSGGESVDEFVERLYRDQKTYLERDRYSSIGDAHSFHTKIVGVSFEGRQDLVAGLQLGHELTLERQPENPYDPNALAVRYGRLQVGFIRKEVAKHIAPRIDEGLRYRARIESLTGGTMDRHRGVNVFIERVYATRSEARPVLDRSHADRTTIRSALLGEQRPRESQEAVLARLEAGKNTLAVMGTGRGKSFCFQYPAACRALESQQKTLVLYPLRALANDQYEALLRRFDGLGIRILRANGAISSEERVELMLALQDGSWDIILSTPEFLQFHRGAFVGKSAPSLLVIDEAHHLFESKHREAYGKLGAALSALGRPQVLALTATAGDAAFKHIVRELGIEAWVVDPTVRENLHVVDARSKKDKLAYLRSLFEDGGKGIVYCNSRSEATKVADGLRKTFRNEAMFYHAGMNSPDRAEVERLFREGALRIVVATSAFGEGIDLPDVRHVVLYHLNFDFTEFNQQAGRAGRDGEHADIHLLFGEQDRRINEFIIGREAPTLALLREIYKGMRGLASGGEIRDLSFVDIARTLDLDKANERTISVAVRIFEDEGLVEHGYDDAGRYLRFLPFEGKVDLARNERFAEGEAEREQFVRFSDFVLTADATSLERIINRPIYPDRVDLLK